MDRPGSLRWRTIFEGLSALTRCPGYALGAQWIQRQDPVRAAEFKAAGDQCLHPWPATTGTDSAAQLELYPEIDAFIRRDRCAGAWCDTKRCSQLIWGGKPQFSPPNSRAE